MSSIAGITPTSARSPDPDKLRLAWVEQQFQDHDPDQPDWQDEWADTLDHYDR